MLLEKTSHKELLEGLKKGTARFTFVKADGNLREITCTLRPDVVGEQPTQYYSDALVVWDVEKNGWRTVDTSRIESDVVWL